MATVITKFYADDGTEFPSMQEAIDHDFIKQLRADFNFPHDVCKQILADFGRLYYLLGEYMKNFPDVGCS